MTNGPKAIERANGLLARLEFSPHGALLMGITHALPSPVGASTVVALIGGEPLDVLVQAMTRKVRQVMQQELEGGS